MIDLSTLTITSARAALKKGEYTSRELTQACLDAIKEKDGELHAFLEVFDDALAQADEADKQIKAGKELPLLGVPIAIKDNILLKGHKATAGSKILEGFVAPYDSTAAKRLQEAGAVIVGRTNCDEFAMGSSGENSAYGPTKNPLDLSRVPGGSSSGSAAAVAGNMVVASLGSDTGGSVRQPAAFTGIVGFKPTYGGISRYGLIPMASSLNQVGTFGKTVSDVETLFNVIGGPDPLDSQSITNDTYPRAREFKKVIGVPTGFLESGDGIGRDVKTNFENALQKFRELGYEIKDVSIPHLKYALAIYYILMPAEVSSDLARFDGVKYGLHVDGANGVEDYFKTRGAGFGPEVRRRAVLGSYVLSSGYYDAYYGSAVAAKRLLTKELRDAFKDVDLLLTPTTPAPAWKFGEKSKDPLSMYLADIFTVPANITGCPGISIPSGTVEREGKSLPLGVLLTADLGREDNLFTAGREFLGE